MAAVALGGVAIRYTRSQRLAALVAGAIVVLPLVALAGMIFAADNERDAQETLLVWAVWVDVAVIAGLSAAALARR